MSFTLSCDGNGRLSETGDSNHPYAGSAQTLALSNISIGTVAFNTGAEGSYADYVATGIASFKYSVMGSTSIETGTGTTISVAGDPVPTIQ